MEILITNSQHVCHWRAQPLSPSCGTQLEYISVLTEVGGETERDPLKLEAGDTRTVVEKLQCSYGHLLNSSAIL